MLPKQNRLKEKVDFDKIFKNGRKLSTPLFLLAYFNRGDLRPTRIGVVAGKGVGGAVQRNRAKRIMREASREIIKEYPQSYDFVLVGNTATSKSNTEELTLKIRNLLADKSL